MTEFTTLFEDDLRSINQTLERKTIQEILDWTFSVFPRVALLTSGQKAGSVLAKILFQAGKQMDLVFADTGVLFPETLETMEKICRTYSFSLKRYAPQLTMSEQTQKYGVLYLDRAGQEHCCHMRKVEPLFGIHSDYEVLLGPLRRGEGGRRSRVPIISLDATFKVARINPIAMISNERYQKYLEEPDTIINPLHAQGYPTIGCTRCTTPVRGDEPQRAGRWRHLAGVDYCGINPSDFARKKVSIDLPTAVVQRLHNSLAKLEEDTHDHS